MDNQQNPFVESQAQKISNLTSRLLPIVDGLTAKIRLICIMGLLVTLWLVVWFFWLKHYAWWLAATAGTIALIPTLILARFWWALAELKNLPDIAGQMVGDAKSELRESVQNLRAGKVPKLGLLSAGKGLWSVGSMVVELRELAGSYLSIATLANPFMLVLGVISVFSVLGLLIISIGLAFFAF
jgi:hypothetical protein